MKNLLTKISFTVLFFSAAVPSVMQAITKKPWDYLKKKADSYRRELLAKVDTQEPQELIIHNPGLSPKKTSLYPQ